MWTSASMAVLTLILLINPKTRSKENVLALACVLVFLSIWIDKGMGMVVTGFVPSTLGKVQEYFPTATEIFITLAIYAIGTFLVTIFYKITLSVRKSIV
jgi:molybdopterin-containing oxidoreductase family membrane subunit